MLELGPEAQALHREVGAYLAGRGVSCLIACGGLGRSLAQGAREAGLASNRIVEASDALAAAEILKTVVQPGDVVLVKASRGMKMEQVIERMKE
jgi:UDP-N-acetylmuramyl pentapeptide synthase